MSTHCISVARGSLQLQESSSAPAKGRPTTGVPPGGDQTNGSEPGPKKPGGSGGMSTVVSTSAVQQSVPAPTCAEAVPTQMNKAATAVSSSKCPVVQIDALRALRFVDRLL
jgi:hypothetical protein